MLTPSSFIAATGMVPVTARPSGVVLKSGQPTGGVIGSTTLNRGDPFCDQLFAAVESTGAFSAVSSRGAG